MITEKRNELIDRILEIRSRQVDFDIYRYRPLSLQEEIELSFLQSQLDVLSFEDFISFAKLIEQEGDHWMTNFWEENISRSQGKHNLSSDVWKKICKIRNRPLKTKKTIAFGDPDRIHTVVPKGFRGYAIDFPEAFNLSPEQLESIAHTGGDTPVAFIGSSEILFLTEDDFEVIPPFFDLMLTCIPVEQALLYA